VARLPLLLDLPRHNVSGLQVHRLAVELGAEIGADFHCASVDAVTLEVRQEAVGGEGGVGSGQLAAVG
jgi:hypothetical protein